MSEELTKLQSIGAQKIYEQTHIPIQNVQALLHNNFDSFTRVQFLGFVSILEREYQMKLDELKEIGLVHFDEKETQNQEEGLFIAPQKKKNTTLVYSVITIVLFIIVIAISLNSFNADENNDTVVDNTLIENVQKNIEPQDEIVPVVISDVNITQEQNSTEEEPVIVKKVVPIPKSFKIVAKSKVWFGYIDIATNKKYQKTFTGEKELDPTKSWLLMFGHGYIDMFVNGKKIDFKSHEFKRFFYEDGKLRTITAQEFKTLNRGRKW